MLSFPSLLLINIYIYLLSMCAFGFLLQQAYTLSVYDLLICSYLKALIARECKDDEAEHAAARARFLSSLSHVRVRCEGISDSRV